MKKRIAIILITAGIIVIGVSVFLTCDWLYHIYIDIAGGITPYRFWRAFSQRFSSIALVGLLISISGVIVLICEKRNK